MSSTNNTIGTGTPVINIGVGTLPYLLFQFMPVIIIGVFSFMSLINQDIRAIIYGIGLFVTVGIAVLLSNSGTVKTLFKDPPGTCRKAFLLTGTDPISIFSLNLLTYAYTFSYLLTGMKQKTSIRENVPVIVFFVCLIAADWLWNISTCIKDPANNNKMSMIAALRDVVAILLGGGVGTAWAMIILAMKSPNLLYLVGLGTRETCTATRQKLRCVRTTPRARNNQNQNAT